MNAISVFSEIKESVEKIDKSKCQRFPDAATDGDYFRQGDVYVVRRENLHGHLIEKPSAQVADGNTRGSRHVLDSLDGVTMYRVPSPTPLDGPILKIIEEGRVLTHPEHGDVILPPGCYQIRYQRAFAEKLRAVRD